MKKIAIPIFILILFFFILIHVGRLITYNEPKLFVIKKKDDISDYDAKYKYGFTQVGDKDYFVEYKIEVVEQRQGLWIRELKRDTLYQQTMSKNR